MTRLTRFAGCLLLITSLTPTGFAGEDIAPRLQEHLRHARLKDARQDLAKTLDAEPRHEQARFALGLVRVLQAVELLGQHQYRFGALLTGPGGIPILRLPVPHNPDPQPVNYDQLREIFSSFQAEVIAAEAELSKVDLTQPIKLPVNFAEIELDLNGNARRDPGESLGKLLGAVNRQRPGQARDANGGLLITLDAGDVLWLRGYCHFLAGFCDCVLAYDHQKLFDVCGGLLYPKHVSSQPAATILRDDSRDFETQILDVIAAIHLINFPIKEPARVESARKHFLEMIRTSRESWKLILAETDDDHEWLPNPNQTGVLQIPVTREFVDGWHGVLNEMEDLLEGRKLVPFWRDYIRVLGGPRQIPLRGRGVNLKLACQQPRDFDLVLTLQGTGVVPYLEEGELSRPETWNNLTNVFRGNFFGFAMWFN